MGAVLAVAMWRWARWIPRVPEGDIVVALDSQPRSPLRAARTIERADGALRQWSVAGVSLLILTIALGAAVLAR